MQLTKRRLTDLWVVGREVVLDDGAGEPIVVWMQKMNSAEAHDANKRCDAARAILMAKRNDEDSDEWKSIAQSVYEYGGEDKEKYVDYVLIEERNKLLRSAEARLANEEKWSKDNFLQGLRDAWNGGLDRDWMANHEDKEALAVKDRLDEFLKELNEAVEDEMGALRESWMGYELSVLQERMCLRLLEMDASQAWMKELYACQLYFSVRDPVDKRERMFVSRREVDELAVQTFEFLHQAYVELEVDVMEGKDSQAPKDSSPSSGVQSEAAMEGASGPVGAPL